MGAFAYQLNNCNHCGKPKNDLATPPPILDQEKLDASTSSQKQKRQDDRVSIRKIGQDIQNKG